MNLSQQAYLTHILDVIFMAFQATYPDNASENVISPLKTPKGASGMSVDFSQRRGMPTTSTPARSAATPSTL